MSLLSMAMVSCTIKIPTTVSDGNGGVVTSWEDGGSFQGAFAYTAPEDATRAEKDGIRTNYTLSVSRAVSLEYGTIIQRNDGMLFRVLTDGLDRKTPQGAGLDIRAVTVQEIMELPT